MEHLRLRQGEARKQKKASVVPQPRPRDHVHLGQQPTWRERLRPARHAGKGNWEGQSWTAETGSEKERKKRPPWKVSTSSMKNDRIGARRN